MLRTMKSRTLMDVVQSPVRNPLQLSPESTSCFSAALPFMVRLRAVISLLLRAPPRIIGGAARERPPASTTPALGPLTYVNRPITNQSYQRSTATHERYDLWHIA